MKVFVCVLVACLAVAVYAQPLPQAASSAAVAAAAAGAAGAQVRQSSADPLGLGGNILPLMALGGNTESFMDLALCQNLLQNNLLCMTRFF